MKPKALVAGIHHWHSATKVGTHYIAEYLVQQGFEVAYISAPITPLHHLLEQTDDLSIRRGNNKHGGERSLDGSLWHYVPFALVAPDNRPLLASSLVLNHWQHASIPNIVNKIEAAGLGEVDLLFIDTPNQPFWLRAISYRACAYRLADNTSGFEGYGSANEATENQIVRSVDKVFTASTSLINYAVKKGAKDPLLLPNGVDLARFNSAKPANVEVPKYSRPTAVYVGAMRYWFDHDAIVALATDRPDLTILLIGPVEEPHSRYSHLSNVKLLGPVPPTEVPEYLALADVGLIPFRTNQFPDLINDVNPLKLYEYMAAGLPVVASRWSQLQDLGSPAKLADDIPAFVNEVSRVLSAKSDGEEERQFASNFDWSATLSPLGNWANGILQSEKDYHRQKYS